MGGSMGAYITRNLTLEPTGSGILNGLTFAVKDVMEVKGHVNSAGNPDWKRTHGPATQHAPVIQTLLQQGARLSGMTHTDELMYSLNGENFHYGTPVNPRAPERIPGGSSSGSAVATASGLADFTLGTDTGGSVRVPASYCGIYGFRPTHGLIGMEGVIPLAPSFDTIGWFARDIGTLAKVAETLLTEQSIPGTPFRKWIMPDEVWNFTDADTRDRLLLQASQIGVADIPIERVRLAPEGLETWMQCFRVLQGLEIWRNHGEWITSCQPTFAPDIAARLDVASRLKQEDGKIAQQLRDSIKERLSDLLTDDVLIFIPTTPGPPPRLQESGENLERYRSRLLQMTSIAGLAGLPQLTIPTQDRNGLPIGLSLIAGRGKDRALIDQAMISIMTKETQHEIDHIG